MKPELLVMAAGLGSRFGGLKQLAAVGPHGERIIDYALFDARRAGVERVVFVIRRELESEFHAAFGSNFAKVMEVAYAFQELDALPAGCAVPEGRSKPWGTGQAVLAAKDAIRAPFMVINADDYYGRESFRILAEYLAGLPEASATQQHYAMLAFRLRNTLSEHGGVSRGICQVNAAHELTEIVEHMALQARGSGAVNSLPSGELQHFTGDELVSLNFWGFTPAIFSDLEQSFAAFLRARGGELKSEFYLPSVVDELIRAGRAQVRVLDSPETWFGVTYPEDRAKVVERLAELIRAGVYPARLQDA